MTTDNELPTSPYNQEDLVKMGDITSPNVVSISKKKFGSTVTTSKQRRERAENAARREYNEKINIVPAHIADGEKPGNVILVRLFKFEFEEDDNDNLIIPKFKKETSDSGRERARLDKFIFQHRGVIIKIGGGVKKEDFLTENGTELTEGQVVWLNQRAVSPANQFLASRKNPVVDFDGFLEVSPASIQMIETTPEV